MSEKYCPLLLAAWISHFGQYDNAGNVDLYCHCDTDCAWYDTDQERCVVRSGVDDIVNGLIELKYR
jgi:hypothetical protein